MRVQNTLATPVQYLKGVGPERAKILEKLGLRTIGDVFYYFPRRYENRTPVKTVAEAVVGEKECIFGTIMRGGFFKVRGGPAIFRAVVSDGKASLFATWFNMPYLQKVFTPKARVFLYGRIEREGRQLKMVHPEYELVPAAGSASIHNGRIVPVYPLTEDLTQKTLRHLVFRLREEQSPLVRETLPLGLRERRGLLDAETAVRQVHFPDSEEALAAATKRLVFDEFLLLQIAVQIKRAALRKEDVRLTHRGGYAEVARFVSSLDFKLTEGQQKALDAVLTDMSRPSPMNRLVQGDVGSGKTVVAAAALAFTVANGFQGAMMAPTDVLAQQLYFNLTRFLEPLGMTVGFLSQSVSGQERAALLERLAQGGVDVLVGTHALIQKDIVFKKLGLAVIDEQHKFGVFQRAALKEKGATAPHVLLLTATPIPRTLALTLYGELDVTAMAGVPKGRKRVRTYWVGGNRRADVYRFLEETVARGLQAYVICPMVDENLTAKSAVAAHAELSNFFAHRKVGLLHGRMKSEEKARVMKEFKEGRIEILVSTVVIEVGVDVPNAALMVIEDAEKFGLAQLHQLRGRVGRGAEESFCILFSGTESEESVERLSAFTETDSGFKIAQKDLGLRGAGEVVGEKQHGAPDLRIGDLVRDAALLVLAREEAIALVAADPKLASKENAPLRRALRERFGFIEENKLAALAS